MNTQKSTISEIESYTQNVMPADHPVIRQVREAAETFISGYVHLDEERIDSYCIEPSEAEKEFFAPPPYLASLSKELPTEEYRSLLHAYNALNGALQYCFFLGTGEIRFGGMDSFGMMRLIDDAFAECSLRHPGEIPSAGETLRRQLIASPVTMLESRLEIIDELFTRFDFEAYGKSLYDVNASLNFLAQMACFKRDLFFKKGLLALMLSNRMLPELKSENPGYARLIAALPVPADYQIPRMLRHFGLIRLSESLRNLIDSDTPLSENSAMELNLRAATVLACDRLARNNGISPDQVDAWLFRQRKLATVKHHLCVTRSY